MTKKDYQAIAAALYRVRPAPECLAVAGGAAMLGQWAQDRNAIANVLAEDNPRFNRELFIEACETGRCRGMRPCAD